MKNIQKILREIRNGKFAISRHARARMTQRKITREDILQVVRTCCEQCDCRDRFRQEKRQMKSKQIMITQKGWSGLKYVEVYGVPAERDLEYGELVHADTLKKMEHRIAEEMLLQQRPICGLEVAFLRKVFGMSRRELARDIQLSDVAILKWEHGERKRLVPTSEIAVRVYFAKKLGLSLSKVTTPLIPTGKKIGKLIVKFNSSKLAEAA